jgi:hypothetical protein
MTNKMNETLEPVVCNTVQQLADYFNISLMSTQKLFGLRPMHLPALLQGCLILNNTLHILIIVNVLMNLLTL